MGVTLVSMVHRWPEIVRFNVTRWRHAFSKVIIGVDARHQKQVLAQLGGLEIDIVVVHELANFANSSWLLPLVESEWTLIIDSDEVISNELGQEIATGRLLRTEANSIALPMRWVWPDTTTFLNDEPWRFDPQVRLVRNNVLQHNYPTDIHQAIDIDGPVLRSPAPLYHLDLVLNSVDLRRQKCTNYDLFHRTEMDGHEFSMNQAYYLPEDRAASPSVVPVPATDELLIESAAEGLTRTVLVSEVPSGLAEMSISEIIDLGRSVNVTRGDHKLVMSVFSRATEAISGIAAPFEIKITNGGESTVWPRVDGRGVAVGWSLISKGNNLLAEGRGDLVEPLRPGRSVLVPCWILVADHEGPCSLRFDLVDEGRRWFGLSQDVPVIVRRPGSTYGLRSNS